MIRVNRKYRQTLMLLLKVSLVRIVSMVWFKIHDKPPEVNLLTLSGLNYNNNDTLLPVCYTYTEEINSNENHTYSTYSMKALPAKESSHNKSKFLFSMLCSRDSSRK